MRTSREDSSPTKPDFAAIERFLKLSDDLVKGAAVTSESLDALFEHPGYRVLREHEFGDDFFHKALKKAFDSKEAGSKLDPGKSGSRLTSTVSHFRETVRQRTRIEQLVRNLTGSNVLDEAIELAQAYLPALDLTKFDLPTVAFVVFGDDARGYRPIVVDILHACRWGDQLPLLVAHEGHHFMRDQMLAFTWPDQGTAFHELVWTLNQIQAEGVADLIDKDMIFSNGGIFEATNRADQYRRHETHSPEIIRQIDRILSEYTSDGSAAARIGRKLRAAVPMSGHPTGHFIARAIEGSLGRNALVEEIGNPFQFFRLYAQAATTADNELPRFSTAALRAISKLEDKVRITKHVR